MLMLTVMANAAAEEPLRELPPVVVSASALPLTEATVNQHVSVYTRADIERDLPASVSDFLLRRAGLAADRGFGAGRFGSLYLRGADPSHVVVLIDGIRQNDPLSSRGSAVDFNSLTLDDVERIEVVRGNASVANSEALAGVVHIFTRALSGKPGARSTLDAGGRGLRAFSAGMTQSPWNASVAHREDGDPETTGFSRTRSANIGFMQHWEAIRLQAQLRLADSDNSGFPDDSGGLRYAVNRQFEKRHADSHQLAVSLEHQLTGESGLELRFANVERNTHEDTPRVAPGIRDPLGLPAILSNGNYRRNELQGVWRWQASRGWNGSVGLGRQDETGLLDSRIFVGFPLPASFEIHRITNSAAIEMRKSLKDWTVQAGLRHEQTPGNQSLNHPSFSMQYRLAHDAGYVGAALSSASKLPSFYALGHPLVGNPALRPEHSRQAEIYYASADTATWKTRVTLFAANYRDLVDFDAGPPPRLFNRARIESTGLELSASRAWTRAIRTYIQATMMNLHDPDSGAPLRLRPRRQASAGMESQLSSEWRFQSGLTYVGSRFDSSIPTGDVRLGGYTEFNVGLQKTGSNWKASIALDNVFNRNAEEIVGTPIGARRVRISIRWSL
jgi:vitamin B12 transporter